MRVRDGEALSAPQAVAERVEELIGQRIQSRGGSLGAGADMRASPAHRASTPTPAPPPLRGRGSTSATDD
jgi:hypothetical protein